MGSQIRDLRLKTEQFSTKVYPYFPNFNHVKKEGKIKFPENQ